MTVDLPVVELSALRTQATNSSKAKRLVSEVTLSNMGAKYCLQSRVWCPYSSSKRLSGKAVERLSALALCVRVCSQGEHNKLIQVLLIEEPQKLLLYVWRISMVFVSTCIRIK